MQLSTEDKGNKTKIQQLSHSNHTYELNSPFSYISMAKQMKPPQRSYAFQSSFVEGVSLLRAKLLPLDYKE